MSWAFGAAGAVSTSPSSGVAYPSGITSSQILLAAVTDDTAGRTLTLSDIGFASIGSFTTDVTIGLWWKIATGSESGSFSVSGGGGFGQCARFTGGPTSLSGNVDNTASTGVNQSGTVVPWPAMTVGTANCLVIGVGHTYDNSSSIWSNFNTPSPWSNQIGSSFNAWDAFGWEYVIQTSATNISAGQWSPANSSAGLSTGGLIASLKPASGAPIAPQLLRSMTTCGAQ